MTTQFHEGNAKEKDFTPTGLCQEGAYENDRNADSRDLFADIIREVYNVRDVIIAHHLVYVAVDKRDGFDYQIVEEIPSADTLIFDHSVAKKLWGEQWQAVLSRLALEPAATRDALLARLYYGRQTAFSSNTSANIGAVLEQAA